MLNIFDYSGGAFQTIFKYHYSISIFSPLFSHGGPASNILPVVGWQNVITVLYLWRISLVILGCSPYLGYKHLPLSSSHLHYIGRRCPLVSVANQQIEIY